MSIYATEGSLRRFFSEESKGFLPIVVGKEGEAPPSGARLLAGDPVKEPKQGICSTTFEGTSGKGETFRLEVSLDPEYSQMESLLDSESWRWGFSIRFLEGDVKSEKHLGLVLQETFRVKETRLDKFFAWMKYQVPWLWVLR